MYVVCHRVTATSKGSDGHNNVRLSVRTTWARSWRLRTSCTSSIRTKLINYILTCLTHSTDNNQKDVATTFWPMMTSNFCSFSTSRSKAWHEISRRQQMLGNAAGPSDSPVLPPGIPVKMLCLFAVVAGYTRLSAFRASNHRCLDVHDCKDTRQFCTS